MTTEQVKTAARQWVVRVSDDTSPDVRAQLEEWLAQSPAHWDAYNNAIQVWNAVAEMKHLSALADPSPKSLRFSSAFLRPVAMAAAVLLVIGTAYLVLKPIDRLHQTAIAEIRDIVLPDGSTATLGGRSSFDTHYTESERRVVLKTGEAIFSVTKDAVRPFIVVAEDISVRAVGTQFEVHRGAGQIRISVLEGVVEVAKPHETMRLAAGQQITAAVNRKLLEAQLKNVSQPVTWRSGILRYEDASLADILSDANRYGERPIELSDPNLGALRLTTSFGTQQVDQLLDSLPGVLPVRIDRSDPGRVIIYPSSG